jgi:ABC-type nitrate/sulfonate/bicarbonate transport system permease component
LPKAPTPSRWATSAEYIIPFVSVGCLLLLWEVSAQLRLVHPFLLPALSDVLVRIGSSIASGILFVDVAYTLYRALAGFLLAVVIGVPLGILMARSASVGWFFDPLVSATFPMPKIAFFPVFVLWFGIFDLSKIMMIAFSCVFPIISASHAATLSVDKFVIWSARSFGATDRQVLREIVLPMAMPQIFSGLQIALPVALIVTIVTEMLMSGKGLGSTMINSGRFADSVGVFAGIVEIAVLGIIVIRCVERIRAALLAWHQESRS